MTSAATMNAPVVHTAGVDVLLTTKDLPDYQQVNHTVSEVVADFDAKRAQGQDFDVTINVGDRRFDAHKDLLTNRIPYFFALFNTNLAESISGQITVTQFDAETVASLLDYAYTGKVKITEGNVQDLTTAANCWQIESVTDECTNFMRKRLRVSNALPIQHICRSMGHNKFSPIVDGFIDKNFVPISETPDFLQLTVEALDELLHRNSLFVDDERQVFEALTRWMEADASRMVHGARLLRAVRCTRLDVSYLTGLVETTPWVKNNQECMALVNEAKEYINNPNARGTTSFDLLERVCDEAHKLIMPVGLLSSAQTPKDSPMGAYEPIMDEWKECINLPTTRGRNGLAIVGKIVYVMGGNDGKDKLSTCLQFNTETNEWSDQFPAMTAKRSAMACGAIDGKIIVAGGYDGSVSLKTVEICDPSAAVPEWKEAAPMNSLRGAPASCVFNGMLYVFGGHDGQKIWKDGEYYNPATNTWTPIPEMKDKRCRFGAASLGGFIYAVGGFDGAAFLRGVERYDPSTNTWVCMKDMKDRRSRASVAVSCGKLFVFGGFDGLNNLSSIEMYQPETDQWQERKSMPSHSGGTSLITLPLPATFPSPVANLEVGDFCDPEDQAAMA